MTSKERRDFIAHEISKRIIGPGYTEDAFACLPDASDEVLDNRSTVVYTGGILYPQRSSDPDIITDATDNNEVLALLDNESTEEAPDVDAEDETIDNSNDSAESSRIDRAENQLDLGIADRADFKPSHIGLVACVSEDTRSVDVDVKYGIYHMLNDTRQIENNEILQNVKVKLGRCSLEQLKRTFNYYDHNSNLITEIRLFGAECMDDLFAIDEEQLTISPRRVFSRREDKTNKTKYLQATSFPRLPRNKVAAFLIKLMSAPTKTESLPVGLTWDNVKDEISLLEKLPEMVAVLEANEWDNIIDNLSFEQSENKARITRGTFSIPNGVRLSDILYEDDPVYNHLLPLLLQYRYFKREQKTLETFTIDLDAEATEYLLPDSNDMLRLNWKVMSRTDIHGLKHKYVKILLSNARIKNNRQLSEDFAHQAELKISSPGIVSYAEPHRSSTADKEYDINEILYGDIKVYAKGVNCGTAWNVNGTVKEVMTTYTPQQLAVAFNPESDDTAINDACDVFDLTLWSSLDKKCVLSRFRALADKYELWAKGQEEKATGNIILDDILHEQSDFLVRLRDNINYLESNDNVFKCFKIANTAMYIQMVISRDPFFKKNRMLTDIPADHVFEDEAIWNYFKNGNSRPKYRPFQLAFLLMNVKSTFENDDPYRKDNVDLIWFPTGGGKTEAYLALTALTIAQRRLCYPSDDGISVIMRYTLRLLTAQQFERASFLICALEYLRLHYAAQGDNSLGTNPITIGMWIGQASSPNHLDDLRKGKYARFSRYLSGDPNNASSSNPFPISYCPWCGCKMVAPGQNNRLISGYERLFDSRGNRDRHIHCINISCCFNHELPISFIDEQLYITPPTLLFATVDKFAQLRDANTGRMFGCNVDKRRKPDLIIQDELHLISGPLGSLVGMYESMVEEVCTERDNQGNVVRSPKIIASTATTRNTKRLIQQLYVRKVRSFPVSGVRYDDNFFSKALRMEDCKRLYLGLSPTGHSASELEIRSVAAQIVAKERLISKELEATGCDMNDRKQVANYLASNTSPYHLKEDLDDYWTLVLYYNNLKSLGRAHSRIGQEIKSNAESMRKYLHEYPSLSFVSNGFHLRAEEFTSRQESSRIKELLVEAESRTSLTRDDNDRLRVTSKMDVVQATNMISVGIDIERWNTMMMIGQPLTTAEYIQSSSRVGRKLDGLVINLFNPLRLRELSLYENYLPYHEAFYKHVEPLMATTFTEQTGKKLATNLYLCYMVAVKGYVRNDDVRPADKDALKALLRDRAKKTGSGNQLISFLEKQIDTVYNDCDNSFFTQLSNFTYPIMNSLRDIESETYIYYDN